MQNGCSWCIGGFRASLGSELAALSSHPARGADSPRFRPAGQADAISMCPPKERGPPATGHQAAMPTQFPGFRRSSKERYPMVSEQICYPEVPQRDTG